MAKYFAIGALVAVVLLPLSIYLLLSWSLAYDQKGGPAIADAIREASPRSVLDIYYTPGDYMDSATVNITMDVTVAEAEAFVCEVVEPIVRNGDPPEGLGVWVWSPGGRDLAVDWDTDCP
jgi:hypothetical protein